MPYTEVLNHTDVPQHVSLENLGIKRQRERQRRTLERNAMGCNRGRRCVVESFIRPSLVAPITHGILFGLQPIHQTVESNNSVIIDYVDGVPVRLHLFTRLGLGSVADTSL